MNKVIDVAMKGAIVSSFVFLPWSIPAWFIALGLYYFTGAHEEDYSGDIGLVVLGAPALPLVAVFSYVENLRLQKKLKTAHSEFAAKHPEYTGEELDKLHFDYHRIQGWRAGLEYQKQNQGNDIYNPFAFNLGPNERHPSEILEEVRMSKSEDWLSDEDAPRELGYRHNLMVTIKHIVDGVGVLYYGYQPIALAGLPGTGHIEPFPLRIREIRVNLAQLTED